MTDTPSAILSDKLADTADNIPVLVAAAQHVERITNTSAAQFSSPMDLAATAARAALVDAQISASDVDAIGVSGCSPMQPRPGPRPLAVVTTRPSLWRAALVRIPGTAFTPMPVAPNRYS